MHVLITLLAAPSQLVVCILTSLANEYINCRRLPACVALFTLPTPLPNPTLQLSLWFYQLNWKAEVLKQQSPCHYFGCGGVFKRMWHLLRILFSFIECKPLFSWSKQQQLERLKGFILAIKTLQFYWKQVCSSMRCIIEPKMASYVR